MIPSKGTLVRVKQAEVDNLQSRPVWMLALVESHGAAFITVRVIDHLHRPMYAVSVDHAFLDELVQVVSPLEVMAEIARLRTAKAAADEARLREHQEGVRRFAQIQDVTGAFLRMIVHCPARNRDLEDEDTAPCITCVPIRNEDDLNEVLDALDDEEQAGS